MAHILRITQLWGTTTSNDWASMLASELSSPISLEVLATPLENFGTPRPKGHKLKRPTLGNSQADSFAFSN
jgi:hypothetical protein